MNKFSLVDTQPLEAVLNKCFESYFQCSNSKFYDAYYYLSGMGKDCLLQTISGKIIYQNELVIRNSDTNEAISINMYVLDMSYRYKILSSNRIYNHISRDVLKESNNIIDRHCSQLCIPIADIIKMYYFTNKETITKSTMDETNIKYIKKTLAIDTTSCSSAVWGMISKGNMNTWDTNNANLSFDAYCKLLVAFNYRYMYDAISCVRKGNIALFVSYILTIGDSYRANGFIRNFLHKEDPEKIKEKITYVFDEVKSLQECVEIDISHEENEETLHSNTINKYRRLVNIMKRKLDPARQKILDTKYQNVIISSIENIGEFFPYYAYRNVMCVKWTVGDSVKLYEYLTNQLWTLKTCPKFKQNEIAYRKGNSDKKPQSYNNAYYNDYSHYYNRSSFYKDNRKNKLGSYNRNEINEIIAEHKYGILEEDELHLSTYEASTYEASTYEAPMPDETFSANA